jgi:hypothetical protein
MSRLLEQHLDSVIQQTGMLQSATLLREVD